METKMRGLKITWYTCQTHYYCHRLSSDKDTLLKAGINFIADRSVTGKLAVCITAICFFFLQLALFASANSLLL